MAEGLSDAATPWVCQVSVCGGEKEGDLIEQGMFICVVLGELHYHCGQGEREIEVKMPPIAYKSSGPCNSVRAHIIHKAIKYVSVVSQAHCGLCFMRVVLNSAAGHHKLTLLTVCQTLSLCCFNILSFPLS